MNRIDAHIHFPGNHPDSIQFTAYRDLARQHPETFAWCTSFDLPRFEDPNYTRDVIEEMEKDFADGALAVKAWKNLGMEVKNVRGEWVTVDDPFPNFAVDTSGRLRDLAHQDSKKVREFFIDCQDRILFGTDAGGFKFHSELSDAERKTQETDYPNATQEWQAYLASDAEVLISGKKTRGLGLPEKVLEKIYRTNALHWYPGL